MAGVAAAAVVAIQPEQPQLTPFIRPLLTSIKAEEIVELQVIAATIQQERSVYTPLLTIALFLRVSVHHPWGHWCNVYSKIVTRNGAPQQIKCYKIYTSEDEKHLVIVQVVTHCPGAAGTWRLPIPKPLLWLAMSLKFPWMN